MQHVSNYQHVLICISKSKQWQWCLAHSQRMYERVDVFPKHPSSAWDQLFTSISLTNKSLRLQNLWPKPLQTIQRSHASRWNIFKILKKIFLVFLCFIGSLYDKGAFSHTVKHLEICCKDFPWLFHIGEVCSSHVPWQENHRVETWCHKQIMRNLEETHLNHVKSHFCLQGKWKIWNFFVAHLVLKYSYIIDIYIYIINLSFKHHDFPSAA